MATSSSLDRNVDITEPYRSKNELTINNTLTFALTMDAVSISETLVSLPDYVADGHVDVHNALIPRTLLHGLAAPVLCSCSV